MEEETVTITKKEYDILLKSQAHLNLLIERGVDNWDGYGVPSDEDEENEDE